MVRDGILDHFHQLDAGLSRSDAVLVKQLHHQPGEPLEGPRDPGGGLGRIQEGSPGHSRHQIEVNSLTVYCMSDINDQKLKSLDEDISKIRET